MHCIWLTTKSRNGLDETRKRVTNHFPRLESISSVPFTIANWHGIVIETNNVAAKASTMLKWTCYAALSKNCASQRPASLDEREKRTGCGNASSRYFRIENSCSCRLENVEILRESSTKKCLGVRNIFESFVLLFRSIGLAFCRLRLYFRNRDRIELSCR